MIYAALARYIVEREPPAMLESQYLNLLIETVIGPNILEASQNGNTWLELAANHFSPENLEEVTNRLQRLGYTVELLRYPSEGCYLRILW
jgi:hypothetical protein